MNPKRDPSLQIQRKRSVLASLALTAAIICLSLGVPIGRAAAYDSDHPDKSGRVMLNARGGLALGVANAEHELYLMGVGGIDLGVAVSQNYNAYLILTPQLQVRPDLYAVMIPFGFQYDIHLVRGLFLSPRVSIGYSALISNASIDFGPLRFSANQVTHAGVAIPELGLKYVVNGRFNIGVEPASFAILFTDRDYVAWYRAMVFLGVNL
jgi:hypothetical protein